MKTQKIYGVPKGVTEIHIDGGLHYCLYTKDGEPEFISISLPDTEEKAPTQFAYDAACTALHKHRERCEQLEAELADAVSLFKLVMDEHPGKERNGNAPGHCHQIPGIWDSDNGAKAGKPCAWCAVWNNAHKFLARHGDKS
ncbi:hypothetical protein [Pseudomonas luteola]|uniref:hypothetical protein n=1 Tax=Pseudomonas luteola TaxID=47886 RepID=UPI0028971684|nr:hypothetical protein [Pseudomonas luteola]